MYIYVSEIFPTELRPIGMGFSLFGHFAPSLNLLQTVPIGFADVGWKYYLVIICWCIVYIPSKYGRNVAVEPLLTVLVVYLFWPETAHLSLEEVAQNFGDEVAVHIHDATDQEKAKLVVLEVAGKAGTKPEIVEPI